VREDNDRQGLVLAHHGQTSLVESDSGDIIRCATRKNLPRTVCGDQVRWQATNPREGIITSVLERRTTLVRPDDRNTRNTRDHVIAANIDQVVVVIASKPSFEHGMLDRYLAAAELISAAPVIVLNKADMLDPESRARLELRLAVYREIGYPLLFTSALSKHSLVDLHQQLKGHTSILVGQSGVGKSSLAQILLPEATIRTGSLSQVTGLGRHTTTVAMLYHLPDGGNLIDSPGVRDFTLGEVEAPKLATGFREFAPYIGHCRFHNCRHLSEPGCAVQDAVRAGAISQQRLENYQALVGSLSSSSFR